MLLEYYLIIAYLSQLLAAVALDEIVCIQIYDIIKAKWQGSKLARLGKKRMKLYLQPVSYLTLYCSDGNS